MCGHCADSTPFRPATGQTLADYKARAAQAPANVSPGGAAPAPAAPPPAAGGTSPAAGQIGGTTSAPAAAAASTKKNGASSAFTQGTWSLGIVAAVAWTLL
jgi:hypothetical protein